MTMSSILFRPAARRLRGASASHVLALVLAAGLLAGCNTPKEVTGSVPDDYRSRHPIVIKEADRVTELFVGSQRGELTAAQRADVLGFANAWHREGTGGVVVDLPTHTGNARAAKEAVHEARALLGAAGVPAHAVVVRPYTPADSRVFATVKLSYPRVAADAGPCGLWPHDLGPSSGREYLENRQYWNLGCASQRNLAAMVDNPADLVQPRAEGPAYRARRTVVLDKYRKGEGTAATYQNPDQGKITDVGR